MLRILACLILAVTLSACDAGDSQTRATTEFQPEDLFPVLQDGRWGYIDSTGTVAIEPQFDRAWRFSRGVALVKDGGSFGFIRPDGSYALEPRFDDAWHFTGDLAAVELDGQWGYVDSSGTVMPDTQIALERSALVEATYEDDAFYLIHADGQYGYDAAQGQTSIEPRFEKAWRFSDGLARAKTNGKWGYINRDGDYVIEPRFDLAWDFNRGLAMVQAGDTVGYINREGRYVWPQAR